MGAFIAQLGAGCPKCGLPAAVGPEGTKQLLEWWKIKMLKNLEVKKSWGKDRRIAQQHKIYQGGGHRVKVILGIAFKNSNCLISLPSGTCFLIMKLKVFPVQKSPRASWQAHSAQVKSTVMTENAMQITGSPILSTNVKFERQA